MALTRNLTDPARAADQDDLEAGLVAPLYENIELPEVFGPVEIVVDDLKVKRFAFTQDDFGDWFLRAGPHGPRIAHAGLLANDLLQLFTLRYAPSQVVGLHTEEELWFDRPLTLDSIVRLHASYSEKFERRGQGYVVMNGEARDEFGNTIIRHRGVEIMRTAPAEVAGRASTRVSGEGRVVAEFDSAHPLVMTVRDDVVLGAGLAPLRKEITLEQVAVFSRYGEGVMNIHNNFASARAGGLTLPIVQGQQLVCYLVELLTRVFGYYWFSAGWLKVKFLKPIDLFDSVSTAGAIRQIDNEQGSRVISLEVWVTARDGSLAAVGWARCRIPADIEDRYVPIPKQELLEDSLSQELLEDSLSEDRQ